MSGNLQAGYPPSNKKRSRRGAPQNGKSQFLIGKPSISMGHLYHGELLVITRGYLATYAFTCWLGPGSCLNLQPAVGAYQWPWLDLDVGQNGRPRGPQMWMSSLVLTIHNFGVPNFDPYPFNLHPANLELPSANQTWLAGKFRINGGSCWQSSINGRFPHYHVWLPEGNQTLKYNSL
jgi:hypothetical protein